MPRTCAVRWPRCCGRPGLRRRPGGFEPASALHRGKVGGRKLPAYLKEPGVDPRAGRRRSPRSARDRQLALGGRAVHAALRQGARRHPQGDHRDLQGGPPSADRSQRGAGARRPADLAQPRRHRTRPQHQRAGGSVHPRPGRPEHRIRRRGARLRTAKCSPGCSPTDPTLSVRADEIEECWRIVEPILAAWRKGAVTLGSYPAGSNGPAGLATQVGRGARSPLLRSAR